MAVNIGIRVGIKVKYGQASYHRESNLPGRAVCGKELQGTRTAQPADWYRRCRRCFTGPDNVTQLFFQ